MNVFLSFSVYRQIPKFQVCLCWNQWWRTFETDFEGKTISQRISYAFFIWSIYTGIFTRKFTKIFLILDEKCVEICAGFFQVESKICFKFSLSRVIIYVLLKLLMFFWQPLKNNLVIAKKNTLILYFGATGWKIALKIQIEMIFVITRFFGGSGRFHQAR